MRQSRPYIPRDWTLSFFSRVGESPGGSSRADAIDWDRRRSTPLILIGVVTPLKPIGVGDVLGWKRVAIVEDGRLLQMLCGCRH